MTAKIYFFRLIVSVCAFTLGILAYSAIQFCLIKTVPAEREFRHLIQNNDETKTIISPNDIKDAPTPNLPTEDTQNTNEFYPDGSFYVIDDLPKSLKNLDLIYIEASDWSSATSINSAKPIIPRGLLRAGKEYKFTKISINNRMISFETEEQKGIYYTFVGEFPKESGIYADLRADLKGVLKKYRNGKRITKISIGFDLGGC